MPSPSIYSEDDFWPISSDLWEETDNILNPCWKAPELYAPGAASDKGSETSVRRVKVGVDEDDAPFKTSLLDPGSVAAGETIIIIGIVGIVFFLIFIVNIIIWARHSNKKVR